MPQPIHNPPFAAPSGRTWWPLVALLAISLGLPAGANCDAAEVRFLRDVAPILLRRCAGCHGPAKFEGEYRVHVFNSLLKPGGSAAPPVVPGRPEESELFLRITDSNEISRMPQEDDPLSAEEIAVIRQWIVDGARFDGHNSNEPIKRQMPPRNHPAPPAKYRVPVPIYSLAFSPDGRELAVAGHHEVTVWRAETGELRRRIPSMPLRIQSLAYSRDGNNLIVGGGTPGDYGELSVHSLNGDETRRVLGTFDDLILGTALSRDGSRVVGTSADRAVRAYSLSDGRMLWESRLHSDWVTCIGVSHDDRFVATGSRDYTVKVLDAKTGALFTTYNGHQQQYGKETGRFEIFTLAFANDGSTVFSAGEGRSIRTWEPEKAREENGSAADMELRFAKAGHTRYITHEAKHGVFRLVVGGNDLFAATGDGTVRQYHTSSLEPIRTYEGHVERVFATDCHPPTHRLATGSFDGEVRVWDTSTGALVKGFIAAPGTLRPTKETN